jgi:proteasome lid subunit RPN8/RPN11
VGEGEAVRAEFFARSGNAPRFDHETIFAVPDALNTLAINVESVSAQDRFPERPMPPRDHVAADEPADRLVIFFQAEGMKRLSAYVQRHASRRQESGGVLIGQVYREPPAGRLYLIIEDFIPAEQIQADQVSLRFTHETWQKLQAAKQARFAAEQQIVGWYHTHPPLPLTADEGAARTVQFFSLDDVSVHRQLFNRPWQVALVMDAESSEKVFYRWEGERVVKSDYYLLA